jgi:hypothetical protein
MNMGTTTILAAPVLLLAVLAYGVFIGYCLGRAVGYFKGADFAASVYRK